MGRREGLWTSISEIAGFREGPQCLKGGKRSLRREVGRGTVGE